MLRLSLPGELLLKCIQPWLALVVIIVLISDDGAVKHSSKGFGNAAKAEQGTGLLVPRGNFQPAGCRKQLTDMQVCSNALRLTGAALLEAYM